LNQNSFLDPSLLAQIKSMYLAARYVAEGAIGGFHKSPYVGYNAEFSHHREYQPGDDLRHIDWQRYGKSGKYYVKQYEESSALNAFLMMDRSASMSFESKDGLNKDYYSKVLIASLAYLLLHQRDGVGFLSFANTVEDFLPISSKMTQFAALVDALDNQVSGGRVSLLQTVEQTLPQLRKKCMIVLVSDFLDMQEELLEALKMIRYYRHEVLAFHVLSPDELKFPHQQFSTFVDVETGEEMNLEGKAVEKRYQENLDLYLKELKSYMHQLGIDYQLLDTKIPLEKALIHFLYTRSRHM